MPCRHALLLCLSLLIAACTSIGPPTLRRDRLDYADALADAGKRETLLNIVKLRYADTPSLVTVSQLVAGYTLEGRVNLGSNFFTSTFDFADDVDVGVGGTFSDRPTVTYTPIKGDDFARVMMTPIPPSELFAMVAAGMPANLTLGLGVESINGLRNWAVDARGATRVDARFAEILDLLGELRNDGVLGFRFDTQTGPRTAHLLLEDREGQALDPRARRLLDLLSLDPGMRSFPIRFGFSEGRAGEIRLYTRSESIFWATSPLRWRCRLATSPPAAPSRPRRARPSCRRSRILPCCRARPGLGTPSSLGIPSSP